MEIKDDSIEQFRGGPAKGRKRSASGSTTRSNNSSVKNFWENDGKYLGEGFKERFNDARNVPKGIDSMVELVKLDELDEKMIGDACRRLKTSYTAYMMHMMQDDVGLKEYSTADLANQVLQAAISQFNDEQSNGDIIPIDRRVRMRAQSTLFLKHPSDRKAKPLERIADFVVERYVRDAEEWQPLMAFECKLLAATKGIRQNVVQMRAIQKNPKFPTGKVIAIN